MWRSFAGTCYGMDISGDCARKVKLMGQNDLQFDQYLAKESPYSLYRLMDS